jgi:uncharacterized protein (DUF58 family)
MKHLIIKSKKRVFGTLLGRNLSKFKGNGIDFREVREYIYGEDAKKIDWKISAKFQKPYVKEFEEERELNIMVCILSSGSLHFGSRQLKSETISQIVALLGFSAIKYDNKFSVILYENRPIFHTKPTKTQNGVTLCVEMVYNYDFLGKNYDFSFIEYLNKFKKSILFLIGDFYQYPRLNLKHETYLIWIRDIFEENPKEMGEIDLIDPIALKEIHTNLNKKSVEEIKAKILKNDQKFIEYLKKEKIPFTKIYTHEDPFFKLMELLK